MWGQDNKEEMSSSEQEGKEMTKVVLEQATWALPRARSSASSAPGSRGCLSPARSTLRYLFAQASMGSQASMDSGLSVMH